MSFTLIDEIYEPLTEGALDSHRYLFLEPHTELQRQWAVNSFDAAYQAKLDGAISRFGAVSIWGWEKFQAAAAEQGYEIIFMEDPQPLFDWFGSLNAEPEVEIDSGMPNTVKGLLPFQVQGYNFMRHCKRGVFYEWSTGTGKTVAAEATILEKSKPGAYRDGRGFDLCLYSVKPNNLKGARKKLRQHTHRDAVILRGTPKRRQKLYEEIKGMVERGEQPIVIMTAETYREDCNYRGTEDKKFLKSLVHNKTNLLVLFDEMPMKYSNRGSQIYRSTVECLYTGKTNQGIPYPKLGQERAKQMFAVAMSATPIRNSPEGFFNCVRILDPEIFGSTTDFENNFVRGRDRWFNVTGWKNLDLMGAKAAHIVHQADKQRDPWIRDQFPEVLPPETVLVDLDPKAEKLYAKLEEALDVKAIKRGESMISFEELLGAIGVLQMICANPRLVIESAREREAFEVELEAEAQRLASMPDLDEGAIALMMKDYERKFACGSKIALRLLSTFDDTSLFTDRDSDGNCTVTKLLALREEIEKFDGKLCVFTRLRIAALPISEWFDKWGISHVVYHGALSDKEKDDAKDRFRADPTIKVFLSTDAGSDSIDLPEATRTIHYDLPWTWEKIVQRENRMHRIDSLAHEVSVVMLSTPETVEDRFGEIVEMKHGFHDQVFGGAIADQAEAIRKSDWLYVLTGEKIEVDDE